MTKSSPDSFSLWLDEALAGWALPGVGLAVLVAVGALYVAGVVAEDLAASLVVLAVGVGVAVYLARGALDPLRDGPSRGLSAAAAVLTLLATVVPALRTVNPGEPLFSGTLTQVGDAIPVPEGFRGRVRLFVSGKLPEQGEPLVQFTIAGGTEPVEGKLDRTFNYARVGRSGRARVAHDHTADFYAARIAPGARSLELRRLEGRLGSPLTVAVYRELLPVPGGPWILAAVALLVACLADARLGAQGNLAVAAGMGLAFGLLVTYNATPAAAVGPTVGGIVLGAIAGSFVGWLASKLTRGFVPSVKRRPGARRGAPSSA